MTPRWISRAAGAAIGIASLALLAALSGWRYRAHPDGSALLRVAFSARPQRLERCRELSAAELAQRPAHMRQRIECVGHSATYQLGVHLDGARIAEQTLRGGGVRHDRPVSVFIEHRVRPGPHELRVELSRVEPADSAEAGAVDSTRRTRQPPLPATLSLTASPTFSTGRVILVTYDIGQRRLILRTQSAAGTGPSPSAEAQ